MDDILLNRIKPRGSTNGDHDVVTGAASPPAVE